MCEKANSYFGRMLMDGRPGSEVYVHDEERLYAVREQNIDDCHGQATWQFVHTSCLYFS